MMKTYAGAGVLLLLAAAVSAVASDDPTRIWSQPSPPSRDALDRLNLQLEWSAYVPMDGRRDGFASVQLDGNQLIVQTRSGMITVLDSDNGGRALWRARAGLTYQAGLPPAFNRLSVFNSDSGNVFALDRQTGSLQWKHTLNVVLSAPIAADDTQIYFSNVQAHFTAFKLPAGSSTAPDALPPPTPGGETKPDDAKPATPPADKKPEESSAPPGGNVPAKAYAEDVRAFFAWDHSTNQRMENKAILSKDGIFLAIPNGSYLGLPKSGSVALGATELYRYAGDSLFSAPPGHADDAAYLSTQDAHVYAVSVDSGRVLWRYIPGKPVIREPVAVDVADGKNVDRDLYVTASEKGLARLNRETGEPVWNIRKGDFSPEADRILSVNPKFVYATDGVGRLLVLDRKNGTPLSRYDVHEFVYPIVNSETDRIYLASNDGLVVCLRDKEYVRPLVYRKGPAAPTEKSLAERVKEVNDKLAKPMTDAGGEKLAFLAYRERIAKQNDLKIFVSVRAFKDVKLDPPDEVMITTPKVDNMALGDVLKIVLKDVGGEYTLIEDTIIISPVKKMP